MSGGHSLPGTTLRERTSRAVADPVLRGRTRRAVDRFGLGRLMALDAVEDPEGLRRAARAVRAEILADLPALLDRLADRLVANGVHVHWSPDAADANAYVAGVAAARGARNVVKSKSMATEETGLNDALEAAGCRVVETDLGEWIVQLARETPSHLIAPALHHDRHSVAALFDRTTGAGGVEPVPEALNAWARARLREEFLRADMGVTGVNFAVADTGSLVLVTNEGNGRMVTTLPPVHVAVLGMERVVATWDQLDLLLGLLTRSASGQWLTSYTTVLTGPRRAGEVDGPEELHVVVLDNGRADVLGSEYHEMLACIRCGACLNTCPVYRQVGGHSYGWVYSGPMGAVLTPLLARRYEEAAEVADASTLCGACMDACPVGIPLQDLLLRLRRGNAADASWRQRAGWRAWSAAWSSPAAYRATTRLAGAGGRAVGGLSDRGRAGRLAAGVARRLPVARGWTHGRALPTPAARRFRDRWAAGDV